MTMLQILEDRTDRLKKSKRQILLNESLTIREHNNINPTQIIPKRKENSFHEASITQIQNLKIFLRKKMTDPHD